MLVFPPGLEFIVAFFGCLIARRDRGSDDDAAPAKRARCQRRDHGQLRAGGRADQRRFRDRASDLQARFAREGLQWLRGRSRPSQAGARSICRSRRRDDIAFLQYTSGSTSDPKGVAVSHANLLANLEMIRLALGNTRQSTYVNWVPLYHDMGLILNALQALYVGATCVLMAPNAFMQRPLNWLRAIHHYRAEVACGPNFGYDLCVSRYRADQMEGVDLSSLEGRAQWRRAGACRHDQRVSAKPLRRTASIRARCIPAYGMAEATLLISGGGRGAGHVTRTVSRAALAGACGRRAGRSTDDAQILVGCGRALVGEQIAIVDPEQPQALAADRVGEIWVSGANVARAYWRNAEATRDWPERARSRARRRPTGCAPATSASSMQPASCSSPAGSRTSSSSAASTTIRRTSSTPCRRCIRRLRQNCGAVFSVPDETRRGELVIVQEVERTARHAIDTDEIKGQIREASPTARTLRAAYRADPARRPAEDHQRQDPAQPCARKLWLDGGFEDVGRASSEIDLRARAMRRLAIMPCSIRRARFGR